MTPADSSALSGSMQERGPQSLTGLLSQLLDDASALVRNEIRLAKAELLDSVSGIKVAGGAIAVAAAVLLAALLTWVATAVLALAEIVAPWLAALIVAAALTVTGIALLGGAKRKLSRPGRMLDQTKESLNRDADVIARRT